MSRRKKPDPDATPPLPDIDLQNDVNNRSRWARELAKNTRARLARFEVDSQGSERRLAMECRACFYLRSGGLAGQAFTRQACEVCATVVTYPTTATSRLCGDCAHLYELCRACGGAFDMEPVSALAPPRKRAEQSAWWEDQKYLAEVRRSRWRSALALEPQVERPLAARERSEPK